MPWLIVGLFALVLYMGDGNPVDGGLALLNEIKRGRRITHAHYGSDGVVNADPQALADQAGVSLDILAAGRMLASEEGQSSNAIKAACCWALRNHAARVGQTVSQVLLWAKDSNHSGYFGTFINLDENSAFYTTANGKPNAADRYASTGLDCYQGEIDIAGAVLTGQLADMTGGADQFDRPKGEKNPDAVAARRIAGGSVAVEVPGIDSDQIRFWRHA